MEARARREGVIVQESGEEVVVYDRERHRAHCLNATAAFVWRQCDGETSPAQIAARLPRELGATDAEEVVRHSLALLDRARLLEDRLPKSAALVSRRELLQRMALIGGLAFALPAVTSIVAPTPAEAVTPPPCGAPGAACVTGLDCCSSVCLITNTCQ